MQENTEVQNITAVKRTAIIDKTLGLCPVCKNICPARLEAVVDKNAVEFVVSCPEHGELRSLYFSDIDFYKKLSSIVDPVKMKDPEHFSFDFMGEKPIHFKDPEKYISTVHINLIDTCNLQCPNCFATSYQGKSNKIELKDIDRILLHLKPYEKKIFKPMVVLIGGEPTIHPELPKILRKFKEHGFRIRLSTNGLRLVDKDYLSTLKENGMEWLLLQFDGFNPETSVRFRGKDLTEIKRKVLENAKQVGVKIHLITMIEKDANLNEVYKMLEYCFNEPHIYAINFYPVSRVGRNQKGSTESYDIIKALEEQSNGSIKVDDFIKAKRIFNGLFRIFRLPILRQLKCTFPMFFYRYKGKIFPITRLLTVKQMLFHPIFTIRYYLKFIRFIGWRKHPTEDLVYMNIEKFYNIDTFDLKEAYYCHNTYLTPDGFHVPFCIYNALYREA